MAALKRMTQLTGGLKALTASNTHRLHLPKTYYTYVNEPSMLIPDKEPVWVKSAEEAVEQAGLASGNWKIYISRYLLFIPSLSVIDQWREEFPTASLH